jgi:hypothetical protein
MEAIMRRLTAAILGSGLALTLLFGAQQSQAEAVAGYDSSYFGESAFLTLNPGDTGQFVVIFTNTGSTGWVKNSDSQVNLAACLDDKVTCNVVPEGAAFNDGSWFSQIAYATHTTNYVGPGQNGFFVYRVKVPSTITRATLARFHGDLVQASTLQKIHPEGYYQDVSVRGPAGGGGGTGATMSCGGGDCDVVAGIATNIVSGVTNIARSVSSFLGSLV